MTEKFPAILLTGFPNIGKTTIIQKVASYLPYCGGFFTREIRTNGQRIGFEVVTLSGKTQMLAEKSNEQRFAREIAFGAYKVNLDAIEYLAVPALLQGANDTGIVIVDEIGPMEIFSPLFCSTIVDLLNNPNLVIVGTIVERPYNFADLVKTHKRVHIEPVSLENRDQLPSLLCSRITSCLEEG